MRLYGVQSEKVMQLLPLIILAAGGWLLYRGITGTTGAAEDLGEALGGPDAEPDVRPGRLTPFDLSEQLRGRRHGPLALPTPGGRRYGPYELELPESVYVGESPLPPGMIVTESLAHEWDDCPSCGTHPQRGSPGGRR